MRGLTAAVYDHVDQVDPTEWDSLMPAENAPATHRFVAMCQDSGVENARYGHVVIRDGGRPVLAATMSRMNVRLELMAHPALRHAAQRVRRYFSDFMVLPVIFGGLPATYGQSCFGMAAEVDRDAVLALFAATIDDLARDWGVQTITFKEFTSAELAQVRPLERHGYFPAASLPSCTLRLPGASFEQYVDSMRSSYRRQVRNVLARQRELGITSRTVTGFAEECPTLFRLYRGLLRRVPYQLEHFNIEFFQELASRLAPESRAIFVEHEGTAVAVAVMLDGPTSAHYLTSGVDFAHPHAHDAYLTLLLEVVRDALQRGKRTVEMGQTSWTSKTRLGAEVSARTLLIRDRSPLRHRALRAARSTLFPVVDPGPRRRVFRSGAAALS